MDHKHLAFVLVCFPLIHLGYHPQLPNDYYTSKVSKIYNILTWLVKYPSAKDDNIQPCQCNVHPNSSVIGMMAIGMRTLSAAFMKFAAEQRETMILIFREDRLPELMLMLL